VHLPLRHISITNFRRLSGNVRLPLDAPVVLIHGPNGAGKTSVLAAIELALTGAIQSLEHLDPRYFAHLPYYGKQFAALEIAVAVSENESTAPGVMTVGPAGLAGAPPALDLAARQFYTERAYLDQVSLGRLLEIYQHTEENQESSLARFVNELLGLDQLDALIDGLADVTDVRRLKKLVSVYGEAEATAESAKNRFDAAVARRAAVNSTLATKTAELTSVLAAVGLSDVDVSGSDGMFDFLDRLASQAQADGAANERVAESLVQLRGRMEGLANRPSHLRSEEAREQQAAADDAWGRWAVAAEPSLRTHVRDASDLSLPVPGSTLPLHLQVQELRRVVAQEVDRLERQLAEDRRVIAEWAVSTQKIWELRMAVTSLDSQIAQREVRAGSLATGLAALREHTDANICPICDRDFSELQYGSLRSHIDQKIEDLTSEGHSLRALISRRDALRTELATTISYQEELRGSPVEAESLQAIEARIERLVNFRSRLESSQGTVAEGVELDQRLRIARSEAGDFGALDLERRNIEARLEEIAHELGVEGRVQGESIEPAWARLGEMVASAQAASSNRREAITRARQGIEELTELREEHSQLTATIAYEAETKRSADFQVAEAERRRGKAKDVRTAASETRAAIVERVFNESLNGVWRDVFVRLAPSEQFIPTFGIPEPGKHALKFSLETVRRGGGTAGSPGTMLSAGNLNTAALSLFVALHLAVEPALPCLVFDDPIQSMDEVHIAQFAGLLRLLAKQHHRQVLLAIHERELFQYLTLELSPAFEGDELITIELGADPDTATAASVERIVWRPDQAVAM